MSTESLWADMAPVASTGTYVYDHDPRTCEECAQARQAATEAHAAWWSDRTTPRPIASPFCAASNARL